MRITSIHKTIYAYKRKIPMGPLWLDVSGCELSAEDKEILEHPTVGGVILFSRNFYDSQQLIALNKSIRVAAKKPIIIGVDQEGGRVQRFKDSFTIIPPAACYQQLEHGDLIAEKAGWLMAAELIAHDIDLSFAPVLDKGHECLAIGNRAFGDDAQTIIRYSSAFMQGMKSAGMATTGKHFPGHGGVVADSHLETPYDQRSSILEQDMQIFTHQINANLLDAMMPAHVIYPHYDEHPASGSTFWLQTILRQQLGFKGIVFSDDLSMKGANIMGSMSERAQQSLSAGCDMLLACNDRQGSIEIIDNLAIQEVVKATDLLKKTTVSWQDLQRNKQWQHTVDELKRINDVV